MWICNDCYGRNDDSLINCQICSSNKPSNLNNNNDNLNMKQSSSSSHKRKLNDKYQLSGDASMVKN